MLGGSNNNPFVPVPVNENLLQYPLNVSNKLQRFGNLNYNAIRSNKRQREGDPNSMQKKLQISHDDFDHPSSIMHPQHVSTGLKLSYDDEEHNSSITSASASMTLAPSIMSSIGDSITTELDTHKEEFERFIMIQEQNLVKGMRDIRQRHMTSLLAAIEKGVRNKLHEKQVEIENINRKNKELVEGIKELANEVQNWHYRAKYNESIVNILKTNVEQALANVRGNGNRLKEGFGETDVVEVSSNRELGLTDNARRSCCRVCRANEVSVLVMPCRHLCLCKDCDGFTSVCPVCQTIKTVSMEVYLS